MTKKKKRKLQAYCLYLIYEGMKTQHDIMTNRMIGMKNECKLLRYWVSECHTALHNPKKYIYGKGENHHV